MRIREYWSMLKDDTEGRPVPTEYRETIMVARMDWVNLPYNLGTVTHTDIGERRVLILNHGQSVVFSKARGWIYRPGDWSEPMADPAPTIPLPAVRDDEEPNQPQTLWTIEEREWSVLVLTDDPYMGRHRIELTNEQYSHYLATMQLFDQWQARMFREVTRSE